MSLRFRLTLIVILIVVFAIPILIIESPLVRSSASLGRLVFTDYPKPNYNFTVDVFDLDHSTRTSLQGESYQDTGSLYVIDGQHFYLTLCLAQNNPMFCSASVSSIIAPKDKHRFENIKPFWKDDYGSPVWSPDGSHIAFSVVEKGTQSAYLSTGDTYVMKADGTNIVDLTPLENINGFDFAWSPDSQRIAFNCSNARYICISNLDGNHLQKLTVPQNATVQDIGWSPDGQQIVFTLIATDYHDTWLYLINADGSNQHLLFETVAAAVSNPIWSPDGSRIVFHAGVFGGTQIYVIEPDGTELHKLSQGNTLDFGTVWSPDSQNVAFFSWQLETRIVSLYVADASRGNPQTITDNSTFDLMDVSAPDLFWIP